jgi:hypothetical protein
MTIMYSQTAPSRPKLMSDACLAHWATSVSIDRA